MIIIWLIALLTKREGKVYPIVTKMAMIDEELVIYEIVFLGQLYDLLDINYDFLMIFLFHLFCGGLRRLGVVIIDG
jgi:hypothetical protein